MSVRHRSRALALALAALMPAACAAPTTPTGSASPSPTASATAGASAMPTAAASASATPAASGAASPTASATPISDAKVVLSGTVYDESGAPIDGADIRLNALDAGVTYARSVKSTQGSYVVTDVPEGVNLEIIATKPNWTTRRRVGAFLTGGTDQNVIDFGSPISDASSAGAPYFISKYPEVIKTAPVYNASAVDPTKVSYSLTLSEALDDANKRRFEDAIRIFPANQQASPTGNFKDVQGLEDINNDYSPDDTNTWSYVIKKGTLNLNDPDTRAAVTWDATNTTATLTFNAALITSKDDSAKYEVGLVAGNDPIVDPFNNQLGTDKANSLRAYPPAGKLIRHAFLPANPTINGHPADGSARWALTHDTVSVFSTAADATVPKLTGVSYVKNVGTDSRFELTFDKPMNAFVGTSLGRTDAPFTTGELLDDVTFAVSDHRGGTSADVLRGTLTSTPEVFNFNSGSPQLANTASFWGTNSSDVDKEFKLDRNAFTPTVRAQLTGADVGKITIEFEPKDTHKVYLYVVGRNSVFDSKIVEIKARIEGIKDPAGNIVRSADADANQVTGVF